MTNMHTFARLRRSLVLLLGLVLSIDAAHAADTVTYYHTDALGTPVMESNAAGTVTYAREHKPYGEQALGAPKSGPGFTGHVGDADTGLTYMQARYYDPVAGRFLSNDPVSVSLITGAGYNRYWYANNNPYRFVDPDGKRPWSGHLCDIGGCDGGSFMAGDNPRGTAALHERLESGEGYFEGLTPWMNYAETQYGEKEVAGPESNPQILEYHQTTGGFNSDEVAWCSSFTNWAVGKAGMTGTNSAMALSWQNWGMPLSQPAYGSIAVINWGRGRGHVGFVAGKTEKGNIVLLGGNQSDSVKYSSFSPAKISGYVYPAGYTPSYYLPVLQVGGSSSFQSTR